MIPNPAPADVVHDAIKRAVEPGRTIIEMAHALKREAIEHLPTATGASLFMGCGQDIHKAAAASVARGRKR